MSDSAKNVQPIEISLYKNVDVYLEGDVSEPSVVILTDNWHSNWVATLNGKPVPILKVNGIFRGILVGNGFFR